MPLTPGPSSALARPARHVAAIVGAGVLLDQVTKAAATDRILNPGGTAHVLPLAVRGLWVDPHLGATLDLLALAPLSLLLLLAVRSEGMARAGWSLMLAGWVSNWADRLGLSALTKPGSPRGAVDWIRLPGLPGVYNVADVLIVVGGVVLCGVGVRRLLHGRALFVATACVCLLAVWVGMWSGSRRATQSHAAAQELAGPARMQAQQRSVLHRRAEHARSTASSEDVWTARAALSARRAGVPRADRFLAPGQRFVCREGAARQCVVLASHGMNPVLVYPFRRPAWATGLRVPPGVCDAMSALLACEHSALLSRAVP